MINSPHCKAHQPAPRDEGQVLSSKLPFPVQPSPSADRSFSCRLGKQRAGVLSGLGPYTDGELVNYFPHRLLLLPFFLFFRCFLWAGAL